MSALVGDARRSFLVIKTTSRISITSHHHKALTSCYRCWITIINRIMSTLIGSIIWHLIEDQLTLIILHTDWVGKTWTHSNHGSIASVCICVGASTWNRARSLVQCMLAVRIFQTRFSWVCSALFLINTVDCVTGFCRTCSLILSLWKRSLVLIVIEKSNVICYSVSIGHR